MNRPEMILFDYGETLVHEQPFDGMAGTAAVLQVADNPHGCTARQVQDMAERINAELGRFSTTTWDYLLSEVHQYPFQKFLYEYMGITLQVSPAQAERIFWDAAAPGSPMPGICELLAYLAEQGIRTGVVSNISYSGDALRERIAAVLPGHDFEFILASSEYVFRKPNHFLFELALRKAALPADRVWFCGDNPICDVYGADCAGMTPVWMAPKDAVLERPPQGEYLHIQDHRQLLEFLQILR
ncbi:MAG: HAD family hydrolase [Eubacteriales bacterium]|nr:HAD family hydrolase [Eubacteriales bacterium]